MAQRRDIMLLGSDKQFQNMAEDYPIPKDGGTGLDQEFSKELARAYLAKHNLEPAEAIKRKPSGKQLSY